MINIKEFNELTTMELYSILKLRSKVFVVEQNCIYLDIDDRDKNANHLYIEEDEDVVAYLRIVFTDAKTSIGRVVVNEEHRSNGYASLLMRRAIKHIYSVLNKEDITISAQAYLIFFYESLGFKIEGKEYLEDGIPHIKMIHKK